MSLPDLELTCTDRGQHASVELVRVAFVVGNHGAHEVLRQMRGAELAEYNAGEGPHAGRPMRVRVTRERGRHTPDGRFVLVTPKADTLELIKRADGGKTWHQTCPRCRRDWKLPDHKLRKLGELPVQVFDLSQVAL